MASKSQADSQMLVGIKRSILEKLGYFQGIVSKNLIDERSFYKIFRFSETRERASAEKDESFKQFITYCVVRKKKAGERDRYLVYSRSKKGAEERLHNVLSLGIGGHVEESDIDKEIGVVTSISRISLCREIKEELGLDRNCFSFKFAAFVNDDSDSVGRVHLGCVYFVSLLKDPVNIEDTINNPKFMTIDEITQIKNSFEGWSKILVDFIAHSPIN